jgi:hypothetical protein
MSKGSTVSTTASIAGSLSSKSRYSAAPTIASFALNTLALPP